VVNLEIRRLYAPDANCGPNTIAELPPRVPFVSINPQAAKLDGNVPIVIAIVNV
jgi:hypothetical protein